MNYYMKLKQWCFTYLEMFQWKLSWSNENVLKRIAS